MAGAVPDSPSLMTICDASPADVTSVSVYPPPSGFSVTDVMKSLPSTSDCKVPTFALSAPMAFSSASTRSSRPSSRCRTSESSYSQPVNATHSRAVHRNSFLIKLILNYLTGLSAQSVWHKYTHFPNKCAHSGKKRDDTGNRCRLTRIAPSAPDYSSSRFMCST